MSAMDYKCFIRSKNQYKILWPATSLQLLKYSYVRHFLANLSDFPRRVPICKNFNRIVESGVIYCKHFGNLLPRVPYLFCCVPKKSWERNILFSEVIELLFF